MFFYLIGKAIDLFSFFKLLTKNFNHPRNSALRRAKSCAYMCKTWQLFCSLFVVLMFSYTVHTVLSNTVHAMMHAVSSKPMIDFMPIMLADL